MLPVLFWLASEESNRRHERRTRQELTQAFDDAWALYKSEADTPFRRGSVNFHSAPTEKHIADKLLAAVKSDTCLIYFYAEGFTTCEASSTCVKLSGGALLDLRELIHEVDC